MKPTILFTALLVLTGCCNQSENNPDIRKKPDITEKAESAFTSDYAMINGIRMYYEIYGSGKPIVLIHGGGSTIQTTFGRIIPILAETRKVIAMELQGHGHTADRDSELSFEQDADDVIALLDHLEITKTDVLGFSNGGNTAILMAINNPDRVDRVIAASPLLKRNGTFPQFWGFMESASLKNMPDIYKRAFLEINPDSVRLQTLHDKCARRVINLQDISDENLSNIKSPVLLMAGDADVPLPAHLVEMTHTIPNCSLAIFPGGHGEYIGEVTTLDPDWDTYEAIPVILKFIR